MAIQLPPPVLTDDLPDAMLQFFWNGDREKLSTNVYYFWQRRYQPIEDEL